MPAASPSRPLRSSRKRIATPAWKSGTPFIRNTVWRDTRATGRPIISKPCASMAPRLYTAIPSRPCANPPAGPPERPKLLLLLKFRGIALPGKLSRPLFILGSSSRSECACLTQLFLHPGHALPRRFFLGARASPVRFEAHGSGVSGLRQRAKLPHVIDDTPPHRRPFERAVRFARYILAMHVPDAFLGNFCEPVRKRDLAAIGGIPGIPVQFEVRRLNSLQCTHSFCACRGVAGKFVFEQKSDFLRSNLSSGFAKFTVHRIAERLRIVQSPEIEAAHAVRTQRLGDVHAALQHFTLLRETIVRSELRRCRAVLGSGCSGPVCFEERAGNIGYLQTKFLQEPPYFAGFFFIQVNNVLVPQASQLPIIQAELLGSNFNCVPQILTHLAATDPKLETAARCW